MKKILAVVFTLLLAVTLVACGGDDNGGNGGGELTDRDYVNQATTSLQIGSEEALANVASDIELPATFGQGVAQVTITWEVVTGQEALALQGNLLKVTRPENETGDIAGSVKATLTKGEVTQTKEFNLVVLKKAADSSYATLVAMVDAIPFADIIAAGNAGLEVTIQEVTVIGHQQDGYFVSDGTYSLYVHGGTKPAIGTTGRFTTKVANYFNGYQFLGNASNFEGDTTTKTEAEIKAMATERTVQEFLDTQVKNENNEYIGWSGAPLSDAKQDLTMMGFFKAEVYVKTAAAITSDVHQVIFYDDIAKIGTEDFIQNYYKSPHQETLRGLGNEAEPVKLTIYASVQEIRDNLGSASYTNGNRDVYRVTVLYTEVELTDAQKLAGVEINLLAAAARDPHAISGDIAALAFTDKDHSAGIAWSFTDGADANNALVDLTTKKVVGDIEGTKEVKLTATLTLNAATKTVEVVLLVGKPATSETPFATINAAKLNEFVSLKGKIVTEVDGNFTNYFLVDGDNRVQVFGLSTEQRGVLDGAGENFVIVTGKVGEYRSVRQLVSPYIEVKLAD